jgi:hypothetical protein
MKPNIPELIADDYDSYLNPHLEVSDHLKLLKAIATYDNACQYANKPDSGYLLRAKKHLLTYLKNNQSELAVADFRAIMDD